MKQILFCVFSHLLLICPVKCQPSDGFLSKNDLAFLEGITRAVLDSSRIYPGQTVSDLSGPNNTKGIVIRPGGRDDYPAFWIRDYAMSLETGMITLKEQKHLLLLTAATQCDQAWITRRGGVIPVGSIADHIRVDNSLPIYFPGTYDYEEQGDPSYGTVPPYCDQFYFIQMAHYYVKHATDPGILTSELKGIKLIDRLDIAFRTTPGRAGSQLVYTTENFRGVDFGFRDGIQITGDLCFSSILKYRAAVELAELYTVLRNNKKATQYRQIALNIKQALPAVFLNQDGWLKASTGWSSQPDVWASALAVYYNLLEGGVKQKVCRALNDAYRKGTISYKGNIRHVPTDKDFSETTAWEKTEVSKNTYQNGAYWGTPTGWVCYAISLVDRAAAKKMAEEFIADLRENDFRKGVGYGAPYECFFPPNYKQNPLYLATVACPYIVLRSSF